MSESVRVKGVSADASGPLAEIVAEITDRLHAGERVALSEYIQRHPELAERLQTLLPALELLDAVGSSAGPDGRKLAEVDDRLTSLGTLGDFRILREVGRGGMGIVYEAEQVSLHRRVALKVLPFAATMDARQLQRFKNEALAAASLEHPHIVPVYAVGCERSVHFYAMKFIDGQSLAEVIGELKKAKETNHRGTENTEKQQNTMVSSLCSLCLCGSIDFYKSVAQLGIQAAEALEHAHDVGIVHRDIKPANLMIDCQGKLWVTDFGLARTAADAGLTMTGDVLGTLRYMSPEQALAKHGLVDHRTDVYSLGVTLYEVLTGIPAVGGKDREEILNRITLEDSQPPRSFDASVPRDLETIVLKAMARTLTERYATARELADDLRRFLEDRPIHARRPGILRRLWKSASRHPSAVAVAVVLLFAISIGLAIVAFLFGMKNEELRREHERADNRSRMAWEAAYDLYARAADSLLSGVAGKEQIYIEFLEKALRIMREFLWEKPEDPEIRFRTAQVYRRLGQAYRSFSRNQQGENAQQAAIALLRELVGQFPDQTMYLSELVWTFDQLGQNLADMRRFNEAELAHREAVRWAELLAGAKSSELRYASTPAVLKNNLAFQLRRFGQEQEAERLAREAVDTMQQLCKQHPTSTGYLSSLLAVRDTLADLCFHLGRNNEAEQAYRSNIKVVSDRKSNSLNENERRPHLGYAQEGLGRVLLASGRLAEAEELFRHALEFRQGTATDFPSAPNLAWEEAVCRWGLANTLWERSKTEEAAVAFNQVRTRLEGLLNQNPESVECTQLLTWLLLSCPNTPTRDANWALRLADDLSKRHPDNRYARSLLGIALFRDGQAIEAIQELEPMMPVQSEDERFNCFVLALACEELGQIQRAREWFEQGSAWMKEHRPQDLELGRLRDEAKARLKIAKN